MEFFLELLLAIALSLIFSFFLAKITSLSSPPPPNCEYGLVSGLKPCKDFIQKVVTRVPGSEGEQRYGFAATVVESEDLGESKQENILLEGVFDGSCGSCDYVKIDENKNKNKNKNKNQNQNENQNEVLKEVELLDFMGRVVCDFGGATAWACIESEKFATLEAYLINDEVGAAKSEGREVLESKCGYDINEANQNEEDEDGYKCRIFDCNEILVDKSNFFGSEKIFKIEAESTKTEVCMTRSEEVEVLKSNCDDEIENISETVKTTEMGMARSEEIEVLDSKCDNEIGGGNKNGEDQIQEVLFDEDDDWEGIERTELERLFGAAVAFVGDKFNADQISSIGSDVKLQLYGLHKIATVGPCHESQPMALKVSARANWNAWKQLGNMTPEIAMEQYVTILSRSITGCIQVDISGDIKQVSADAEACSKLAFDLKAYQGGQLGSVDKRNVGKKHATVFSAFRHFSAPQLSRMQNPVQFNALQHRSVNNASRSCSCCIKKD